jgi:tetratricopeptide (TPR) repeat protein
MPRLRDWVNENRGFLAWQEQLRYKRAEWEPAHDNTMLLTGQALNTALEWVRKRGDEITQTDREFISRSARERRSRRLVRAGTMGFLLLIAGSIGVSQWQSTRRERASPLIQSAMAFHDAGRNDSAAAYFERALAFDPNQRDALLGLAEIRLAGGDPENAIPLIDRTIAADSGSAGVWSLRGNAYALAGQPQRAIVDYNRALSIDSSASDVRFNRALAYEESGDSVSAIADYWQLLNTGDAPTRQAATARLERLGVQTKPVEEVEPRVYFHYTAPADLRTVTAIAQALGRTFDVRGVERRSESTQGDVRSFHSADADVAETVASMVEKELAGNGYPLRLRRLRPDSTRFGNVPRGQIEVWLPSLSTPVFRK